jgi:glycosyltransferase involved in cell wall biosynthesis
MRVAYLMNQYPMVSHTFIRREILALERSGVEIVRIAVRGWDSETVDPVDILERRKTLYVLSGGVASLLLPVLYIAISRPLMLCRALALVWQTGRRADRPLRIHLAYLLEACFIAFHLRNSSVQHLHAHFGTNPAQIAMLVHILGGPAWSFTVHGPEEFDKKDFIALPEKIRRSSFVVAVSSYGRSQLLRCVDYNEWPKIYIVHCGIEKTVGSATSPCSVSRRLVCVGRLCEQKGQLLLLEAAQKLAAQGIEFELILAGDGEMRSTIEGQIAAFSLDSRVKITGWISGDQVQREILAARALVLPSFAEGLPVVIMEAMALRRPVISTFVAGIPELVHSGRHGWLVPAGDSDALASALNACLGTGRDELVRMGQAAHQWVLLHHDVETETKKLAELFRLTIEDLMHKNKID